MFLTVNMVCTNFLNRFLTLIVNGIFGSSHSRVLLKIVILYMLGEFLWCGPFPVELQVLCLSLYWGWAPGGCFSSILFIYRVNCCFLGNSPQWLVHNFKYTFHLNLHERKALQRVPLCGWIFDKYLVLNQFFIKHQPCVGNLQSFSSQMANLLIQCFY